MISSYSCDTMKKTLIWIFSFVLTLCIAAYQRMTGPTYPQKVETSIDGKDVRFRLPRTHGGTDDMKIKLALVDTSVSGIVVFRRYPTDEPWDTLKLSRNGNLLTAALPAQPAAGKLQYRILLEDAQGSRVLPEKGTIIARFKGNVPAWVLIPHILFVFTAMLFSSLAGTFAAFGIDRFRLYGYLTVSCFIIGGFVLGPVVQKFAFGQYWTGFPFGGDLTDNKVLFSFIIWLVAIAGNYRKDRKYLVIIAAFSYLLITLIPHSMFGSEFNYESGHVVTGWIRAL